jgi:hypothetical protein
MNWLSTLLEDGPNDPFYQPRKPLWLPRENFIRHGFMKFKFDLIEQNRNGHV